MAPEMFGIDPFGILPESRLASGLAGWALGPCGARSTNNEDFVCSVPNSPPGRDLTVFVEPKSLLAALEELPD
ncbi:uncharacterized protein N7483_007512 [Penicillium malachiteum]|uniref:uncharacterized protein n=1 Tax=Penicillium malachiteum TaxID=1324776 RepID=UPI002549B2B7|nr:uncharacterized protein N7483_007512 [Penicillium malachiteum]KAJ5726155.1 hypothetical protein N7483_007512 [Penicillium malachiteum]